MTLAQLLGILRGSRWSILLMMLVCIAVAWGYASTLPKQYTAKARVMLDLNNAEPTQYSVLQRNTEEPYIATQIRLVRELPVLLEVVDKLGWANDPSVVAVWQQATGGQGDIARWLAARLSANMAVGQLEESAILEIYYASSDLEVAKQIVGMIRTAYINNNLALRVAAARRASAWNRTQAARAYDAMRKAETARIDFMQANGIILDSTTMSLEARETTKLRQETDVPPPVARPQRPSGAMYALRGEINRTDAEIALLELNKGPDNPQARAMKIHRDELQAQLDQETAFVAAGANASAAAIEANRQLRINEYLKARLSVIDRIPLYDKLGSLDREVDLRRRQYQGALQRVQNFDMIAAAPSGLEVIGDVIADEDSLFPNIPLIVALAALFGLGLGITLAIFGEMFARRVRGADDLGFFAQVPVLAVIAPGPARPNQRFAWASGWPFGRRPESGMQPAE